MWRHVVALAALLVGLVPNHSPGGALALITIKAGIVMMNETDEPFRYELVGPAIDLAIERAESEYNVRFIKHELLFQHHCNKSAAGGFAAELFHQEQIQVMFGPGCSEDILSAGEVANYYGIPLVTGSGDLIMPNIRPRYPLLTRLSWSVKGGLILSTWKLMDWKSTAVIYDETDPTWRLIGLGMINFLRNAALFGIANSTKPYAVAFNRHKPYDMDYFLTQASKYARVIVLFVHGDTVREAMLNAHRRGWTQTGEYCFLTLELYELPDVWGSYSPVRGDEHDEDAKEAYRALFKSKLAPPRGPVFEKFTQDVKTRAANDYGFTGDQPVTDPVGSFYDAVIYMAHAINTSYEEGLTLSKATAKQIAQRHWNSTFIGYQGKSLYVDPQGDKRSDFVTLDYVDGNWVEVMYFHSYPWNLVSSKPGTHIFDLVDWPGTGKVTQSRPPCGFQGEDPSCSIVQPLVIGVVVGFVALILIGLGAVLFLRHRRHEEALANMEWRISHDDVVLTKGNVSAMSVMSAKRLTITIGTYHDQRCAVRELDGVDVSISRAMLEELKTMRELAHENLAKFVGLCIDDDPPMMLMEYCVKGSLQDILANDAIKLDWVFRYSLMGDIIKGMRHIHNSSFGTHGRLKSSNCVVDGRFVLKITDYGPPILLVNQDKVKAAMDIDEQDMETNPSRLKFWTAPELLRDDQAIYSQACDVYSFGIIMYEIITRNEPFDEYDMDPDEVLNNVKAAQNPAFRPRVESDLCTAEVLQMVEQAYDEDAQGRPTFNVLYGTMNRITKAANMSGNILDNVIKRLEQYAENLEAVVDERTKAFVEEKKKSDELLYHVLPRSVADQLKQGRMIAPEAFDIVTIYFSDVVGFTSLAAASSPTQVVDLLNDLYTCFDAVIAKFDVYKVETIGDAYMLVSGLPIKNGNEHSRQIALVSLALVDAAKGFRVRHLPGENLKLRIGLHSGPVVAGVVGHTTPRYCLFGDTVNTASRMESTGEAYKIHLSSYTKATLDIFNTFEIKERGEIPIKGKGNMTTYWLTGTTDPMALK